MSEPRKTPGVAFWATVVVVALLGYPLSFGPACWWSWHCREAQGFDRDNSSEDIEPRAPLIYWPLGWTVMHGPVPIARAICWYATFAAPEIYLPADARGGSWLRDRRGSSLK